MASVAEEIAALRGTRPTTFRELLVDATFSRLWRAMLVSSLGDWIGFVAVASLGATIYTALALVATHVDGGLTYLDRHPEALALWLDGATFLFSARMVSRLDLKVGAAFRAKRAQMPKLSLGGVVHDVREGIRFL